MEGTLLKSHQSSVSSSASESSDIEACRGVYRLPGSAGTPGSPRAREPRMWPATLRVVEPVHALLDGRKAQACAKHTGLWPLLHRLAVHTDEAVLQHHELIKTLTEALAPKQVMRRNALFEVRFE